MICPVVIPNCCLYALWAFPIVTFHIVPHMPCGHQYAPWAYPHGHQYAPWAFPNLPCGRSHSHMPCGHCQQALMPRGPPQCFLFQWRLNLPMLCPVGIPNRCLYVLWAFPILTLHCVPHMPCGHQYTLWVYPHGHQYAPWAFPILPCGHPYSHRPCGHSQKAPMCRGPPQRFLFQRRPTLPWYALSAFPIAFYVPCGHSRPSQFHIEPHMPCGHQYALWVFPHCHTYAPWAFPLRHVGIPNKRLCPVGSHKPAFFSEDLPCHYLPWGHSQFALICRVGIPNPYMSLVCPVCPVAFGMPWWAYRQGHPYTLLAVPLSPVDIPNKCICPVGTPNPHVFTRCLPRSL